MINILYLILLNFILKWLRLIKCSNISNIQIRKFLENQKKNYLQFFYQQKNQINSKIKNILFLLDFRKDEIIEDPKR